MNRIFIVFAFLLSAFTMQAQDVVEQPEAPIIPVVDPALSARAKADSIAKARRDSLVIEELRIQIQELKLNEILIRNEIVKDKKQTEESDSIKRAHQREQIEALRAHTKGTSLVIEGDTLLTLYAKRGGVSSAERIGRAERIMLSMGKRLTMKPDSIFIFESEYATDIMNNEQVILTLTDLDGLWQNTTRQDLAVQYLPLITNKVKALHEEYGLSTKIKGLLLSLLVIFIQGLLIFTTYKMFRRLRYYIYQKRTRLRAITFKDYEFLDVHKQVRVLMFLSKILRLIIVLLQLFITIPILFSIFPETEHLAYTLFSYFWNPLSDIVMLVVGYLPKLIKIIVICLCFKYLNKSLKYFANEIATGKLRITGFYDDWAFPTYYILRFLIISFMFVMIWPLLPNSESAIFQGVSVFVGLVISLGSTTVIGNLMAGMVLTYMRSFKIGDDIKLNDGVTGSVIEKTPFVTRIRTPKNNIVTVPNSTVMSAQTVNYTMSAQKQGVIVHSDIGVSYEYDRVYIEQLLIEAALKSKGVLAHPRPFVLVKTLEDFYCYYQINAYTKDVKTLARVYSSLHGNIMDVMHGQGIELVAPHFMAKRDGSKTLIPEPRKEPVAPEKPFKTEKPVKPKAPKVVKATDLEETQVDAPKDEPTADKPES